MTPTMTIMSLLESGIAGHFPGANMTPKMTTLSFADGSVAGLGASFYGPPSSCFPNLPLPRSATAD